MRSFANQCSLLPHIVTNSLFPDFVMDNHLNRHTFGFIQSRLFPFYHHIGSACAFFNLAIFAVYHPSDLLDENEAFQVGTFISDAAFPLY